MAILRQYIAPFLAILMFLVALAAVSARIFLPADMAAPAPVDGVSIVSPPAEVAGLPPSLEVLVKGIPADPQTGAQL